MNSSFKRKAVFSLSLTVLVSMIPALAAQSQKSQKVQGRETLPKITEVNRALSAKNHDDLPTQRIIGKLEPVAFFDGPMPTGVTVSQKGRIFVNFPRWGDKVDFTVAEIKEEKVVAFPSAEFNKLDLSDAKDHLVSVQSVVVDPADRLWILDTGSIQFGPVTTGGAKMVCVDLNTNKIVRTIYFSDDVVPATSYLNDMRFDLNRGKAGTAFISDSGGGGLNGIIVVDLASGESVRRLAGHPSVRPIPGFVPTVEGAPMFIVNAQGEKQYLKVGVDGIAIGADGKHIYYSPLCSRKLYSVSADALCDLSRSDSEVAKTVCEVVEKGASDGLESDSQGHIYATDYEHNAVHRFSLDGQHKTIVCDPRLLWPDTLSLANDGYLYVTANQLHRQASFNGGQDKREKPYVLFRVKLDGAKPVLLKAKD
jgi:sugar lactone lactonase YvrE